VELHIGRAYLSAKLVRLRPPGLNIYCKAWPVRNRGGCFSKNAFELDWQHHMITYPNFVNILFRVGSKVNFPASACPSCPLRQRCTTSSKGRSVSIHPDEPLLEELRVRQLTATGRAKLRERVVVEHCLAPKRTLARRSRSLNWVRKNLFDLPCLTCDVVLLSIICMSGHG